jgi:hypothetical protein
MDRAWIRKRVVWPVATLLLVPAGFWGYVEATDNFGAVVPGRVFRSGQMGSQTLARTVHEHHIRTVLNLRGPNPTDAWYLAERAATIGAGATQVDVALSSCEWMSRAQLRTLIRTFDTCEYPILIHCQYGSERTSLVSAFFELLRPGSTLDDAGRQFSLRHLFVRVKDGKVMAEHLDQYVAWLRRQGAAHSPERFREWAETGFTPRWPTREMWPYDPKPLVVVTRPERAPPVAGTSPRGERR